MGNWKDQFCRHNEKNRGKAWTDIQKSSDLDVNWAKFQDRHPYPNSMYLDPQQNCPAKLK